MRTLFALRSFGAALLFVIAVSALPCRAETADTKARTASASAPGSPAAPADLQAAISRLAKATSPAEYASMLDSYSTVLSPPDGLTLLNRCLSSVGPDFRGPLILKAGNLSLLLGLFADAAARYEEAAARGPASDSENQVLLLRAARCLLAAGDTERAFRISSAFIAGNEDSLLVADARLVEAWSLVLQGRLPEARVIIASLLGGTAITSASDDAIKDDKSAKGKVTPGSAQRREARFISWLCASAGEKAAAGAALVDEFPGSPEALITAGAISPPPLPHWYLGGLSGLLPVAARGKLPSLKARAEASPEAKSAPTATVEPPASLPRGKRLQVGYFSLEDNALALKDELASKRFAASVESRSRPAASGNKEDKRWIVLVEGGKDIAKTRQSLKDAGYESYIID